MKNEYEVRGDISVMICDSKKYGRIEVVVDTEQIEKIKSFPNTWSARWDKKANSFYVSGHITAENGKETGILLHRFIMEPDKEKVIDHINRNTLDNRRSNMRIITRAENRQNLNVFKKGSSGIRGVHWKENCKKWQATATVGGKRTYLGVYENLSDAEKAVKDARAKLMPFSEEAA